MESKKFIINALKLLQRVCGEHTSCDNCPLRNSNNECGVIFDDNNEPRPVLNWDLQNNDSTKLIVN